MDPSSGQHQERGAQTLESVLSCPKAQQEKKARPQPEQALKCPRCDSTNTKFCYYNNYSLSQPRYFCKSCRRYWTKGGTLRNVPVGGGCRKNKRSSSKRTQDQGLTAGPTPHLPPLTYNSSDLSLAFARLQKQPNGQLGFEEHDLSMYGSHNDVVADPNAQPSATPHSFLEALKSGFLEAPSGLQSLYYGMGGGTTMGLVENGNGGLGVNESQEMGMAYEEDISTGATTMKQEEGCNGREGETRVLWGFPWQIGGDGNVGDLDLGRESWINGIGGSSWHGLLNSPLM